MWPQFIINSFGRIPAHSDESGYYGAWNSVLNFCFKIEEGYEITPQKVVGNFSSTGKRDLIDFVVLNHTITKNEATILFVQVNAQKDLPGLYARQEADNQMRKHFAQLYDSSSTSIIHGVSAFGGRLCFDRLDKKTAKITPRQTTEPSPHFIIDTAPMKLWDVDISQPEGYVKFMEIVNSAKLLAYLGELE